jgi:hypothetical protein
MSTEVSKNRASLKSHYAPEDLKPGNRSVKRSSDKTPTSPFMRSSSSRRAEMAGRSRRLLRRLLRGCGTPFGASILKAARVELQWLKVGVLELCSRGCMQLRPGSCTSAGPASVCRERLSFRNSVPWRVEESQPIVSPTCFELQHCQLCCGFLPVAIFTCGAAQYRRPDWPTESTQPA